MAEEELIVLTDNSEGVGTKCTYCQKPLSPGDEVVECPRCHKLHHLECWRENSGCARRGCPQVAEKYRVAEVRAGRDDERRPKTDYRRYVIPGLVLVALLIGWVIFGPEPPDPAAGKIALDFMLSGGAQEQSLYQEIVDAFNQSQDEVYVFLQVVPPGGYEQKLLVMIGARDAPDVFTLHFQRLPVYGQHGALVVLDELLATSGLKQKDFGERLTRGTFDGQIIGIPHPGKPVIIGISSLSENREAAWQFLEFFLPRLSEKWPEEWTIPDDAALPKTPVMPGF